MGDLKTFKYFVANKWYEPITKDWFDSENPATGEVWAKVPNCGKDDVDKAVTAAKHAFYNGPWGKLMPSERGKFLRKIGDVISKYAERLGKIETQDNGKLPNQIIPSLKQNGWLVDS